MKALSSTQRRYLKAAAHHLKPLTYVGKEGVTPGFVAAVLQTLTDHELVKVKFNEFTDEKGDLSQKLAEETASHLIAMVGNTAILFRQRPDPERRRYSLPA